MHKWLVVISGTAINLALGVLYAWSMFKEPLTQSPYNLSNTQTAIPYSIACLTFAIVMVPAGRLQDRFGPRSVASIGGLLVGAGMITASYARELPQHALPLLSLGFGVLAGAGIGLGYAAASPPAIKWFPPERKGLIVGIVVAGFGLASVYVAPLTEFLVKGYGVAYAFKVLGVLFLVAIILFAQTLKNPPKGYLPSAGTSSKSKAPSQAKDFTVTEMLKTSSFWLAWFLFFVGAGAGLMVISFVKSYAKEVPGVSIAGFVFVALLAVGNAGGRIIAGLVSDKLGRTRTMFLVFLVQATTLVLFSMVSSSLLFAVGAMVIGFCYGSCLSVFPSLTADYYGLKNLGINYGLIFSSWGIAGLVMAPLAGKIKDHYHSYNYAFYLAAGMLVLAALVSLAVRPPTSKAAEAEKMAA